MALEELCDMLYRRGLTCIDVPECHRVCVYINVLRAACLYLWIKPSS